jgi:hypothetical protein
MGVFMRLFVQRRTFGIQARLTMLSVATALPLVALASFAILRMVDDQRTQIQQDVKHWVENLLGDMDRQIGEIQAELQVLAVSPNLQNGDFAAFDRQMRAALKIREHRSFCMTQRRSNSSVPTGHLASRCRAQPIPKCTITSLQRVSHRFPI